MRKSAVKVLAVMMAVGLLSCAGTAQKRVENPPVDKPADIAAVDTPANEKRVVRPLDEPPKQKKITPKIGPEYSELVKAFDKYWEALKTNDYKSAYNLESAEFQKTTGFDQYKGGFKHDVRLKNVTALGVKKISEKEVIVSGSMILKANMEGPRDIFQPFSDDRWVKEGEAWRHVPQTKKN